MKRIGLTLTTILLVTLSLFSQNVDIPDANFLYALIEVGVDTNEDSLISYAEAEEIPILDIRQKGITDMTGIEAFVNLNELDCGNIHWPAGPNTNKVSSLDVSNNSVLTQLRCSKNNISSLNVSGCTALTTLLCDYNELSSLDISACNSLLYLDCSRNQLTSLDVSNHGTLTQLCCFKNQISNLNASGSKALKKLYCQYNDINNLDISACDSLFYLVCTWNSLSSLDVSDCTALNYLDCHSNKLSSLDVSNHEVLRRLRCSNNPISNLNVSGCMTLDYLFCENNKLSNLDISDCDSLKYLVCSMNQLTSLDVSNNAALLWLYCNWNRLSSLDVSKNIVLDYFECGENQLSSLDVSNNPALRLLGCSSNQLSCLDVSNNTALMSLGCGVNQLSGLDISGNTDLMYLYIQGMTSLREVCVMEMPFPPEDGKVNMAGSPGVFFTTECSDIKPPCIMAADSIYQPGHIEATSSEDGVIYLVPENTQTHLGLICGLCIDSVVVVSNTSANISSSGLEDGVYWLYARDSTGNISEPKAITIIGVGIQQSSAELIRLYPNPTNTFLTIETEYADHYSIKITSLNGQEVFIGEMEGSLHQIDLSSFQKGVYFITIRLKDFVKIEKIIKL